MQAETTNYFVVWWVQFEYSSFDHFSNVCVPICPADLAQFDKENVLVDKNWQDF